MPMGDMFSVFSALEAFYSKNKWAARNRHHLDTKHSQCTPPTKNDCLALCGQSFQLPLSSKTIAVSSTEQAETYVHTGAWKSHKATLQSPTETYSCLPQIIRLFSPIAQTTLRSKLTQGQVRLVH